MPPRLPEIERTTNRWMSTGLVLTVLLVLAFPFYRLYEPAGRAEARESQQASLIAQGFELWDQSCASCHGANGEGVDAPALNSRQFLSQVVDEQIASIIAHGMPGTEMSAWSFDFGGPLTAEQILALMTFIRSWEEDAPDRPDWRIAPSGDGHDDEPAGAHDEEAEEPNHADEPAGDEGIETPPSDHDDVTTTTEDGH